MRSGNRRDEDYATTYTTTANLSERWRREQARDKCKADFLDHRGLTYTGRKTAQRSSRRTPQPDHLEQRYGRRRQIAQRTG
jgi:hypothetical protein